MRIHTIHVDHYGQLHDLTLRLEGPLTVLYGRNEAGKSTLIAFIRAVLFGFPQRAGGAESYGRAHGAARGGYITLLDEEGAMIRVERREGAPGAWRTRSPVGGNVCVTLAGGEQGGAELLQPLLGGITGELFRSLFAFGLSELAEVRTLQSDSLSGYLYSAGLGAHGSTIMAAERKLAMELEQLFRPRGKNQSINQTLHEMESLETEIRRGKEKAGRYNEHIAELAALDERIAADDAKLRSLRHELAWQTTAEQARNYWLRNNEIHCSLLDLPLFDSFPEDAASRLSDLNKEKEQLMVASQKLQFIRDELQAEIALVAGKTTAGMEQIAAIAPQTVDDRENTGLQQKLTALADFFDERIVYRSNISDANDLQQELARQQPEIERFIKQISADWDETTFTDFAITIALREQVRQYLGTLQQLKREQEIALAEQERTFRQWNEAQRQQSKLETNALQWREQINNACAPEIQQKLDDLTESLTQLRKQWQQIQMQQIQMQRKIYSNSGAASKSTFSIPLYWLVCATAIILPTYFLWQKNFLPAGISFILLIGIAFYIYLQSNKGKVAYVTTDMRRFFEPQLKDLYVCAQAVMGINKLREAANFNSALPPRRQLIVDTIPDEQIESVFEQIQHADEQWREVKRELRSYEQRIAEAYEASALLLQDKTDVEMKLATSETKLAQGMKEWQAWLLEHQLSAVLSPNAVLEVFQLVEQVQQQLQIKRKNSERLQSLYRKIQHFEQQAHLFLAQETAIALVGEKLIQALQYWKQLALDVIELQHHTAQLNEQLTETKKQLALNNIACDRNEQRLTGLLHEANAVDEQQFRLHLRQHSERIKLLEESAQIERALRMAVSPERLGKLDHLLQAQSSEKLTQCIADLTVQIKTEELAADENKELRGKLRGELIQLEKDAELSERLQQLQEQKAVLTVQAGQWATRSFCAALFKKTREFYERERQPGVLQEASQYFKHFTDNTYVRVAVPFGEKRIVVEHANGEWLDSSVLSRGTAEQLYLAMRFALAGEFAHKAALPIIMDDILVNFDRERLYLTVSALDKIAENHQLLLFTCHPHVVDAFQTQTVQYQLLNL